MSENRPSKKVNVTCTVFEVNEGELIEITHILQKIVGNVMHGIVFGKRFEFSDPEFDAVRNMLTTVAQGATTVAVFTEMDLLDLYVTDKENGRQTNAEFDGHQKVRKQ